MFDESFKKIKARNVRAISINQHKNFTRQANSKSSQYNLHTIPQKNADTLDCRSYLT